MLLCYNTLMKKCKITITNENEAPYSYDGFWDCVSGIHKLTYVHEDDGQKSDYELTITPNQLKIKRGGDAKMAILIKPDEKGSCIIRLPQGRLVGDVETFCYSLEEGEDTIRLNVTYDMIFGGERNCRKLTIETQIV